MSPSSAPSFARDARAAMTDKAIMVLMVLATALLVVIPLHAHVAVWSWSFLVIAGTIAWFGHRDCGWPPHSTQVRTALRLWAALALVACLIDGVMSLGHGESLNTMRHDGNLLVASVFTLVLWPWAVHRERKVHEASSDSPSSSSQTSPVSRIALNSPPRDLPLAALWPMALVLQMGMAAWVAVAWPRAHLPPSPLPWATGVALSLAVIAPLVREHAPRIGGAAVWRAALWVAVVAGIVAVLGSRSRSAWIVLPWLMVMAVATSRHRIKTTLLTSALAAGALLTVVHHEAQLPVQVERGLRLLDLWEELARVGQPDAGSSTGSRVLMWQAAWQSLLAHPWTGIGMQGRVELVQQVVPPTLMVDIEPLVHVHQQFLNQAVDHGVPGLIAACLSAGALGVLAWKVPAGTLRWQLAGVAVVHVGGLLFNANMTHGPYAFAVAMAVVSAVMMHAGRAADEGGVMTDRLQVPEGTGA